MFHASIYQIPALFLAVGFTTGLAIPLPGQTGMAVYEITFDSTWSRQTHPKDFPSNPHFSSFIGGTHDAATRFWEVGGLATPGIESMAETGATSRLRSEVQAAIGSGGAYNVVQGSGLGTSPGSVTVRFSVSASHSHLTLVSMLAPSPDWFVGVSGVDLMSQGRWLEKLVLTSHVYDAGTDSGVTYRSSNFDTQPRDRIARVTTASGPFQNTTTVVGMFTIQRIASAGVYGCGVNPAGSMVVEKGVPVLGQTLRLALHDPLASIPTGSSTLLFFSIVADPAFPCGTKIPGFGFGAPGSNGELLLGPLLANVSGATWQGSAVPFDLTVPNQPALIGSMIYAQGVIGSRTRVGLTDAVEVIVGN